MIWQEYTRPSSWKAGLQTTIGMIIDKFVGYILGPIFGPIKTIAELVAAFRDHELFFVQSNAHYDAMMRAIDAYGHHKNKWLQFINATHEEKCKCPEGMIPKTSCDCLDQQRKDALEEGKEKYNAIKDALIPFKELCGSLKDAMLKLLESSWIPLAVDETWDFMQRTYPGMITRYHDLKGQLQWLEKQTPKDQAAIAKVKGEIDGICDFLDPIERAMYNQFYSKQYSIYLDNVTRLSGLFDTTYPEMFLREHNNVLNEFGLKEPTLEDYPPIPPGGCKCNSPTQPPLGEKVVGQYSPIILDLDGDGVKTKSIENGVYFDHDNNRFAEKTGWVDANDALLVWDRDGNGQIDGGNELFGNNYQLADGSMAENGFEALKEFDSNGDGIVDARDARWSELRLWRDANGNGVVDDGELLTRELVYSS